MITVKDIANIIEKAAPLSLAEEWDKVGLQVGNDQWEVKKIMTALDVDMKVLSEAIQKGCNMIVCHHPLVFSPVNFVTNETPVGRLLLKAAENKVAIYSAHTNLDCANGGTNDFLCTLLELEDVKVCESIGEGNLIRIGTLNTAIAAGDAAKYVAEKLGLAHVRIVGDKNKKVRSVAVCSGGGADYISEVSHFCDLYITGDVKYHSARLAEERELAVVVAEHFDTEKYAKEILKNILFSCGAEVVVSEENKDPFIYINV